MKAASPNHAGGPTIIVTIILVLVTRKPWNTKQPWLIRRSIDRISVRYYPTTVIAILSSHAAATRRTGKRIEKRSIDVIPHGRLPRNYNHARKFSRKYALPARLKVVITRTSVCRELHFATMLSRCIFAFEFTTRIRLLILIPCF